MNFQACSSLIDRLTSMTRFRDLPGAAEAGFKELTMSCPACDGTMQCLDGQTAWFWCPRCGTVRHIFRADDSHEDTLPKLVGKCREFRRTLGPDYLSQFASCRADWQRLGIAEAIGEPEAGRLNA